MNMIEQHRHQIGALPLCKALKIPRASFYRQQIKSADVGSAASRQRPEHALSETEQQKVLATAFTIQFRPKFHVT